MKLSPVLNSYVINTPKIKVPQKNNKGLTSNSCLNFTARQCFASFDVKSFQAKENAYFEKFLNNKGKVTLEEYEQIKKNHPSTIVKAYALVDDLKYLKSSPKTVAKAAVLLKDSYDKIYDKKYTIASIGTSPAPITEVMSALGANVVFVPASGLNKLESNALYIFRDQFPTTASRHQNLGLIFKYMKQNGINPSNKDHLILLDYCCSGASLTNFSNALREEYMFAPKRIHEHSILPDLAELSVLKDKNSILKLEDFAAISSDMQCSNFQDVSNVPHFYIHDYINEVCLNSVTSRGRFSRKIFSEFNNFSLPEARAFSLCAINEAFKILNNKT